MYGTGRIVLKIGAVILCFAENVSARICITIVEINIMSTLPYSDVSEDSALDHLYRAYGQ